MTQIYEPLPTKAAIRLLRIQPGLPEESIRCSLDVSDSLETAPPYEALSYVWGAKDPPRHILLNGKIKPVAPNLYEALVRLRPRPGQHERYGWYERVKVFLACVLKRFRLHLQGNLRKQSTHVKQQDFLDISHRGISDGLVWIDALCINQDDVVERGQQVSMMGLIYERAKQVVIWLGNEDEHIPRSMPLISKIACIYTPTEDERGVRTWSTWDDAAAESHGLPKSNSPTWSHLACFLCNPWFTRIWVLQELLLASNVITFIGRFRIDHQILGNATHNIYRYMQASFYDQEKARKGLAGLDVMFKYPQIGKIKNGEQLPLGRLLHLCRVMDSGDPRDKVFAVLSMSTVGQSASIPRLVYPDYSKTRFEVYRDAAHYIMEAEQTLKYLVFSVQEWSKEKPASWVSDLDMRFEDQGHNDLPWKHNAGGNTLFLHEDGDHADELRVRGHIIERVVAVLDNLTPVKQKDLPSLWKIIAAMQESCVLQGALLAPIIKAALMVWAPWLENSWHGKGRDLKSLLDDLDEHWSAFGAQDEQVLPSALTADLLAVFSWSFGRRFFQTQDGRLGLGPPRLEVGDIVTVLHGGPVLYVLRGEDDYFRYIGDCAMENLMNGERVEQAEKNSEKPVLFKLY